MIKEIKSRQNELIKEVAKLSDASYRKEIKKFKVDGFHMFEMAKSSNRLLEVFTLKEIKDLDDSVTQYLVSEEVLEKISSSKSPQGIVSVCEFNDENEIKSERVLYLDGVSDPGNLGTILRTALAFGFNDVILSKKCCSIYNEKALQASQGAIFNLNIVNDKKLLELKKSGYSILATEIEGSLSLKDVPKNDKIVLVLGNEAHGVSESILKLADKRIRIDIQNIESLNVAIAGAIAMYELSKNK